MNDAEPTPRPTTALAERRPNDAMAMIAMAIERNVDAAQLEKLLGLQERHERNQAEGAFAQAITAFQQEMPAVKKNKNVDGKYNYATYDQLMMVAAPLLKKHGIVVSFDTEPVGDRHMKVTCKVRVGIHAEPTCVTVPFPPGNKAVNETQIFGQAVSYGKRYALCAALNIVTTDEDQDATYREPSTADQVGELNDLIEKLRLLGYKVPTDKFCAWLGAERLDQLSHESFLLGKADLLKKVKEWEAKAGGGR